MTNEELTALRVLLREEVNSAVYASESRLSQKIDHLEGRIDGLERRLDGVEQRLDGVEQRLDGVEQRFDGSEHRMSRLEDMVRPMAEHLILLRSAQRQMQSDIATIQNDLTQSLSILDGVTVRINELQVGQHELEANQRRFQARVEDQFTLIRRDIQKLSTTVQGLSTRLDRHESLPVQQAHPNSAA